MEIYQLLRREPFQDLLQNCVHTGETQSLAYGEGEVLIHKTHKVRLFVQNKVFNDEEALNKFKEEIQMRLMITNDCIQRCLSFQCNKSTKQQKSFCSSVFKIQQAFEYSPHNLLELIKRKSMSSKRFTEEELITLMDRVLIALMVLSSLNIRHGFIQPKNILIDKGTKGWFKLSDVRFLTGLYEYKNLLMGYQTECYLSPELFIELGRKTMNPIYNYDKSEVFSLGVTLLHCIIQKQPEIYDFNTSRINQQKLKELLNGAETSIENGLYQILAHMLSINENDRASIKATVLELNEYTSSKFNMQTGSYAYINQLDIERSQMKFEKDDKDRSLSPLVQKGTEIKPRLPVDSHETGYSSRATQRTPIRTRDFTPITYSEIARRPNIINEHSVSSQTLSKPKDTSINWDRDRSASPFAQQNEYKSYRIDDQRNNIQSQRQNNKSPILQFDKFRASNISILNNSLDTSVMDYDIMGSIRIDAPRSLIDEFSRLDYKLDLPNQSNRFPSPGKNRKMVQFQVGQGPEQYENIQYGTFMMR